VWLFLVILTSLSGVNKKLAARCAVGPFKEFFMGTILLVILVLFLIGALPSWPHSRNWGYGPSGITGLIVVILIIMLLTGRL
jgi:hypothetical protein